MSELNEKYDIFSKNLDKLSKIEQDKILDICTSQDIINSVALIISHLPCSIDLELNDFVDSIRVLFINELFAKHYKELRDNPKINKVYVVVFEGGEYDDYDHRNEVIFFKRKEAEKYIKEKNIELKSKSYGKEYEYLIEEIEIR